MAIITISRQNGSLGDELADYLAGKLNCEIISRAYAMENFFGGENDDDEDVAEKLSDSAKFFLTVRQNGFFVRWADLYAQTHPLDSVEIAKFVKQIKL